MSTSSALDPGRRRPGFSMPPQAARGCRRARLARVARPRGEAEAWRRRGASPGAASLAALAAALVVTSAGVCHACPGCATSQEVWSQIRANDPGAVLGTLTIAFVVVGALIGAITRAARRSRWLLGGSLLLGAGLGAFLDGIVLHQTLQWHSMISTRLPPQDLVSSKVNMFWDGIFHLYSWAAAVAGVALLVRELPGAEKRVSERTVAGGAMAGWGLFNLVEGLIDHQIAGLHHVHPGVDQVAWDVGFLASGVLLIAGGGALAFSVLGVGGRGVEPRG